MFLELKSGYYLKWIGVSLVLTASCISESGKKSVSSSKESGTQAEEQIITELSSVDSSVVSAASDVNNYGMIYFPGGTIKIGSEKGRDIEQPVFTATVQPFWLDKNLVTVKEFRKFVNETGYKTDADKFGNSLVFDFSTGKWNFVDGANWEFPLGRAQKAADDNFPVTHISYRDATNYAVWIGKRLPTELEWEYAARNGKDTGHDYPWGDKMVVEGKFMANIWQGQLKPNPDVNDDFLYTSPVGYYGETPAGLNDMSGNVWQWTETMLMPYPGSSIQNRAGPDENSRVLRGGSFMYDEFGPLSNSVWFRSSNTIETSLFNMGFRCAK
jgi:sulfatase modifying factor 1